MELDIEKAKKYYLVPFKDRESLFWVGGPKKLLALEMVMDAKDVIATTGVNLETCYILINRTGDECKLLIDQMNEVLKNADNKGKLKEDKKVR